MSTTPSRATVLERVRRALQHDGSASMVELAAAAGISLRQLYRLFGSRDNLLHELDQELPPGARERILEAALDLLGESGLADLPMDELAARADVSRATLYRLFPGKAALFRELIIAYSPWEPVARVLEESAPDSAPRDVIPRIADTLAEALADRSPVLLRMVFEMARGDPQTTEGVLRSMQRGLPDLIRYLGGQMAAGRLRQMHPVAAMQLLAGPIVTYELTRPLAGLVGFAPDRQELVAQVVDAWLRAMAPAPEG